MPAEPAADLDTIRWLLADAPRCPACGRETQPDQRACQACGRALVVRVWAQGRSAGLSALVWVWGLLAIVAALIAIGAAAQLAGWIDPAPKEPPSQIIRSLARLAGVESFDAPVAAPPPPRWLPPLAAVAALAAGAIAAGIWARRTWALLAALAISGAPLIAGAALALRPQGDASVAALAVGLLASAAAALIHLGVAGEIRGEWRAVASAATSSSPTALYDEGHRALTAGLTFLAARCWAQALAREPGSIASMHALALALARLGHQRRALALIEQALHHAPGHPELLATESLLRQRPPGA